MKWEHPWKLLSLPGYHIFIEDWASAYDKSLPAQKEFDLSRYTEVTKKMIQPNVVIVSASEGALDKFMGANAEMVAASGHVMESTVLTTYMS